MEGLSPISRCGRGLVPQRRFGLRLLMLLIFLVGLGAHAQDRRSWKKPTSSPTGSANFRAKVEDKNKYRWTLQDWLAQKERNKMMDLWLGMYAPSPYELIFSVSQLDYSQDIDNPASKVSYKSVYGSAAFYAMILGVEVDYENNWLEHYNDAQGYLNLRIAGNSNQSTHWNLQVGLRNRNMDPGIQLSAQTVVGTEMDIYIERHSGIHGLYRSFLAQDETTLGSVTGQRTEGGIFFEIDSVRFFGNWFSETFNSSQPLTSSVINRTRTGWQYGMKFFF